MDRASQGHPTGGPSAITSEARHSLTGLIHLIVEGRESVGFLSAAWVREQCHDDDVAGFCGRGHLDSVKQLYGKRQGPLDGRCIA